MVGVSHQHASLDLLEQVAVDVDQTPRLLESLRSLGVAEAAVLSTCSRTELYVGSGIDAAGFARRAHPALRSQPVCARAGDTEPRWTSRGRASAPGYRGPRVARRG